MKIVIIAALASLLGGCASAPAVLDVPLALDAADPAVGLAGVKYGGVVNYRHRDPVDPKNWRNLNDNLAPAREGSGT